MLVLRRRRRIHHVFPDRPTHARPDSLERIADELQEWSEMVNVPDNREIFDHVAEFADRIRKLAEKED